MRFCVRSRVYARMGTDGAEDVGRMLPPQQGSALLTLASADGSGASRKPRRGRADTSARNQSHYVIDHVERKDDAVLADAERRLLRPTMAPAERPRGHRLAGLPPTLAEYAAGAGARGLSKPATRRTTRACFRPDRARLGEARINMITPTAVRAWSRSWDRTHQRVEPHAYQLLRTIMRTAVDEQIITSNPRVIRAGGSTTTQHKTKPAHDRGTRAHRRTHARRSASCCPRRGVVWAPSG